MTTKSPLPSNVIIGSILFLFLAPILLDLVVNGWERTFSYFAADSFYYFVVARNFATHGYFTFDQFWPTNGFHPLWQVILGYLYVLIEIFSLNEPVALTAVLVVNLVFISGALILFAKWFSLWLGYVPGVLILLPVGLFAILLVPVNPRYGSLWNFANGMESSIVLFAFALLLFALTKYDFPNTVYSAIVVGLLTGIVLLSRLDHGLVAVAIFVMFMWQAVTQRNQRQIYVIFLFAGITTIIVISYVVVNLVTNNTLLPVSGSLKSSFPYLTNNFSDLFNAISGTQRRDLNPRLWRHAQMIIPVLMASYLFLKAILKSKNEQWNRFEFVLATYSLFIILLGTYNWIFVPLWHQGHWYFPVSILYLTIAFCFILVKKQVNFVNGRLFVYSTIVLSLVFFIFIFHDDEYNQHYQRFLNEEGPAIKSFYHGKVPKLISYDDGIIAYTTQFPTMSGLGFTLDTEAAQAKERGQILCLASSRGFHHLTSFQYFNANNLDYDTSSTEIQQQLASRFFLTPDEVEPFTFSVDYLSHDNRFAIIKMVLQKPELCAPSENS